MAINLQKGQTINLDKDQYNLSQITIGLGWDVRKQETGFLSGLFGAKQEDYDLDAIAFLLNDQDKLVNIGDKLKGGDVIYFNNLRHPDGTIYLTGDNRTGAGDGDDEQIIVHLNSIAPRYQKILFLVSIYEGRKRKQHFGMIENAFIRAVDAKGQEIARYSLSGDPTFNDTYSMIFAEAYRKNDGWKFRAIGEPQSTDSFFEILKSKYL